MKISYQHRRCSLLIVLLLWILHLPFDQAHAQDSTAVKHVELQSFAIDVPTGDDWIITARPDKDSVSFVQGGGGAFGLLGSEQSCAVLCLRIDARYTFLGEVLSEEEVVKDRHEFYKHSFQKQLPRGGTNLFTYYPADTLRYNGREFYGVEGGFIWDGGASHGKMYAHFPDEYAVRKTYFQFVILQAIQRGVLLGWGGMDEFSLEDLLKTFIPGNPLEALEGDNGAILRASVKGDTATVSALLARGVSPNVSMSEGTPLTLAAREGHFPLVQLLIENGARQDAEVCGNTDTPLHAAIDGGATDVVPYLLSHGADVNATVKKHWTPLMEAVCGKADTSVLSLLIRSGAKVDAAEDEYSATPLFMASHLGSDEVVSFLLDRGANPRTEMVGGWSPFLQAVKGKKAGVVKVMLDRGSDPNEHMSDGWSVLMTAASEGNIEIVNMLLAKGAKVDAGDDFGRTALAVAVSNKHVPATGLLIDKGADVNCRMNNGRTPLMLAAMVGDTVIVRALIDHHAVLTAEDEEGDTALDLADDYDQEAVVAILEEAGADD